MLFLTGFDKCLVKHCPVLHVKAHHRSVIFLVYICFVSVTHIEH